MSQTLDLDGWIEFKDSIERENIFEVYKTYFLSPIGVFNPDMLVKQNFEKVLELKTRDGSDGFAYVFGDNHGLRTRALIDLNYQEGDIGITFQFDDYSPRISGFAWRGD